MPDSAAMESQARETVVAKDLLLKCKGIENTAGQTGRRHLAAAWSFLILARCFFLTCGQYYSTTTLWYL
jgi:hypothetical protein